MCKGIAKILNPEDFDSIQNADDLGRIDLGDELIPLIQTVLGKKVKEREALQAELDAEFDSDFTSFKERVAELRARSQGDWEELQELKRDTLKLLEDLKQKQKEKQDRLGKLTRQIEELDNYLK